MVVRLTLCRRERGVVAGGADGGDERGGIERRGGVAGGDLGGMRHEVDVGGGYTGDGFEGSLNMDLAGGTGHALDVQYGHVGDGLLGHALADSTKAG